MSFLLNPFLFVAIFILLDLWIYLTWVRRARSALLRIGYLTAEAAGIICMIATACISRGVSTEVFYWQTVLLTVSFVVFIPTAVFGLFGLLSYIPRLWHKPDWRIAVKVGCVASVIAFVLAVSGLFNRKRLIVNELELCFESLPESFDGYRIAHISDLHLGSFNGDTAWIAAMVDRINGQKPDLIVFTGDLVSRKSDELAPYVGILSRLKAEDGIYGVNGNHDYDAYSEWNDIALKNEDVRNLRRMTAGAGIVLLNDYTAAIRRKNDSINVIGTQFIGRPPAAQYGSLPKALKGTDIKGAFNILLQHDPNFWCDSIAKSTKYASIALTLSGHTHATQCNILGLSPSALTLRCWSGVYNGGDGKMLNVNTGIGTVGPLMRIGATPSIDMITLRKLR